MSTDYTEFESKMKKTASVLAEQYDSVRAGKANPAVLDRITVDYYGSPTPIQQIASISTPDARSLLIQPWDASVLKGIEKAILASDLGLNPQNDGRTIRLVFPALRSAAVTSSSRSRNTAKRPRSPCATSAATRWTSSRRRRKSPRSPRTTSRSSRRICRS